MLVNQVMDKLRRTRTARPWWQRAWHDALVARELRLRWNFAAVAAFVVAVAPCAPGFLHTVGVIKSCPPILDRIYTYAWFVTFAIAFVVYGLLMLGSRSVEADRGDAVQI